MWHGAKGNILSILEYVNVLFGRRPKSLPKISLFCAHQ